MGLTGLVAGLVILLTHRATAPIVHAAREERLVAAARQVLPGSARLREVEQAGPDRRFIGGDEAGREIGTLVRTSGRGYQDEIVVLYGIERATGRIAGLLILENRETPGLGDRIAGADFLARFRGLALGDGEGRPARFVLRRGGRSPHSGSPGDAHAIDAISGATVSSRALVDIMNRSLSRLAAAP